VVPSYVHKPHQDRYLNFIALLGGVTSSESRGYAQLPIRDCENICIASCIIEADAFGEAPVTVLHASRHEEKCTILFACTDNRIIAYRRGSGNDKEWKALSSVGSSIAKLIEALGDQISAYLTTYTNSQTPRFIVGITTNPGHQLLNEICPSLYLMRLGFNGKFFRGKHDYWGLKRWPTVFEQMPAKIPTRLIRGVNLAIHPNAIRVHGYTKSLCKYASADLSFLGSEIDFKCRDGLRSKSKRVSALLNQFSSEEFYAFLHISLRSDRKRKLLDDPIKFVSNSLNLLSLSAPALNKPTIVILIDTFSLPCRDSEFPYSESAFKRELSLAQWLQTNILASFPHVIPINITGFSMIEKLAIIQYTQPCFFGYLGSGYCMYYQWSGYDAPAFFVGHDHLLDRYFSPSCTDRLGESFLYPERTFPVYSTLGCIHEASHEPLFFEFFSIDPNCVESQIRKFCDAFWAHSYSRYRRDRR
jgi:hypothetical protein